MMDLIKALLPSISVGLLFWYVIRNIFRADRNEREQVDKYYSEAEVSENNSDTNVMLTSTNSSEYEKSEHGKGNAPRSHG